jgi:hypothetical protein
MQKTSLLPGHRVYEYPYTPDSFPFFYDKKFWNEYLDFLAANRFNTLYLWNGHPFRVAGEAERLPVRAEVPGDVFARNVEMFRYITKEADRRGIWVVQQFYSIIISKPFADKNGLSTQLRESTPLVDDYMRKSIAEFVRQYPHVGLMPCLGEALQGQENQTRFLVDVILPGIKDGAKLAGLTEEPPVVIRTHATDLRQAMPEALKVTRNLYTEAKFNGESLTDVEAARGAAEGPPGDEQARLDARDERAHPGKPRAVPVRRPAVHPEVRAGGTGSARGARAAPVPAVLLGLAGLAGQGRDAQAVGARLDLVRGVGRYAWNPDVPRRRIESTGSRASPITTAPTPAPRISTPTTTPANARRGILRRFGITEATGRRCRWGCTSTRWSRRRNTARSRSCGSRSRRPGERLQEYVERRVEQAAARRRERRRRSSRRCSNFPRRRKRRSTRRRRR